MKNLFLLDHQLSSESLCPQYWTQLWMTHCQVLVP
jgi:hypothetical protein